MAFFFTVAFPHGPRRVETPGAAQLAYRDGGGLGMTLFGLPFLAVGIFCLACCCWFLPWKLVQVPPQGTEWLFVALGFALAFANGATFTAVGIWCIAGRQGVILDKQSGTVRRWWRLLCWHGSTVWRLSDYRAIKVERTGGSFRSGPTYSLFLSGGEQPDLAVATVRVSWQRGERLADEMATFLGLPVGRSSGGTG
jgi:hypothetical protein